MIPVSTVNTCGYERLVPSSLIATITCADELQLLHLCACQLQAWALENLVVPMARSYNLEKEYQYLRPSIKRFPKGREQVQMALSAGFSKAVHYEIGFGLMGVLVATSR